MPRKLKRTVKVLKAALTQEATILDENYSVQPLTGKCIDIDPKDITIGLSGGLANINIQNASKFIDRESVMYEHLAVHRRTAYRGHMWNLESAYNDSNVSAINVTFEIKEGKTKKKYVAQKKKVIIIVESNEKLELGFNKDLDISKMSSIGVSRKANLKDKAVDFITFTQDINQEIESLEMTAVCTTKDETIDNLKRTIAKNFEEQDNSTKRLIDLDYKHYARIKDKKNMGCNPIHKEEIYEGIVSELESDVKRMVENITTGIRQKCFGTNSILSSKDKELYEAIQEHPTANTMELHITGPIILKENYNTKSKPITAIVELERKLSIKSLKTAIEDLSGLNPTSRSKLATSKCKQWFKGITLSGAKRKYTLETPGNVVDTMISNHQNNATSYSPTTKVEVEINVR